MFFPHKICPNEYNFLIYFSLYNQNISSFVEKWKISLDLTEALSTVKAVSTVFAKISAVHVIWFAVRDMCRQLFDILKEFIL